MSDSFDDSGVLDTLLDRLPNGERTPPNLQIAVVATLLEAAHASGKILPEEVLKLSTGISSHLGLSDAEIGHLIEVSEILRKDPQKRMQLLTDVGANFSLPQRQEVLSIVWRILIIDGKVDQNEANIAVVIRKALDLSMEAAVAARIMAEQNEVRLLLQAAQGSHGKSVSTSSEDDDEADDM